MKLIVSRAAIFLVMSLFAWSPSIHAQEIPDISDIIQSECDRLEKECEKLKEKEKELSGEADKCWEEYRKKPLLSSGIGSLNQAVVDPIMNWLYYSNDELDAINKKQEECSKKEKAARDAFWEHKECRSKLLEETKLCGMHLRYDLAGH